MQLDLEMFTLGMLPKVILLLLVSPTLIVTLHNCDAAFGSVIMQNSLVLTYSYEAALPL